MNTQAWAPLAAAKRLAELGKTDEAIEICRSILDDPTSILQSRAQQLLEELLTRQPSADI